MNDLPNASSRGLPALVLISAWVGGMTSAVADPATYRYTAQQGDTLIALGQSLLERPAEWPRLQQINRITNPRRIPVGQVIQIPVTMLRAKEVAILGEADEGYGKFAWLLDPDGVKIELWEQVADELP